jgi:hypothetical protein
VKGRRRRRKEEGALARDRVMCLVHTCVEHVPLLVCVTRVQMCVVTTTSVQCAMFGHVLPRGAVDNSHNRKGLRERAGTCEREGTVFLEDYRIEVVDRSNGEHQIGCYWDFFYFLSGKWLM